MLESVPGKINCVSCIVTSTIFEEMIVKEFHVNDTTSACSQPMTTEEENALRYVAGFVLRQLHEKFKSSCLPNKEEMIACLVEVNSDEINDDRGTEAWTSRSRRTLAY